MTSNVIGMTITSGVTLGSGSYGNILTISTEGAIIPASGESALYGGSLVSGITVVNDGTINGNQNIDGVELDGPSAYINNAGLIETSTLWGIRDVNGSEIVNSGIVSGGMYGVIAGYGTSLDNSGQITGSQEAVEAFSVDTITNSGFISSANIGADLSVGDFLDNQGTIEGDSMGVLIGWNGTIINRSTIISTHGQAIFGGKNEDIINTGVISARSAGIDLFNGGSITNAGTIGGNIAIYDSGSFTLTVDPGAVFNGAVQDSSKTGILNLAEGDGGVLGGITAMYPGARNSNFAGFQEINFEPGANWVISGVSNGLAAGQAITGFTAADKIDVTDFLATSETYIAGTGLVLSGALGNETIDVTGSFDPALISIHNDGNGGTDIAACYLRTTKITLENGRKVAIESLRAGDFVQTLNGPKQVLWIGQRDYDGRLATGNHLLWPIRIRRHALSRNVPSRDLFVSPGHGIYVDSVLVPAWRLINGRSITQIEGMQTISYLHIELETHEVIFAENCPAESFLDNGCRLQFHNGSEVPSRSQLTALPRIESGFHLRDIQRNLVRRAGIAPVKSGFGIIRGFVDVSGPERLCGWAQHTACPEIPVELDVFSDGVHIGNIIANEYRADLRRAGLGSGTHGFTFELPRRTGVIFEVRGAQGGEVLPKTAAALAV